MSFSTDVKDELCKVVPIAPCCRHALCYGMVLFGKRFSGSLISFLTELPDVAELYKSLLFEITGVSVELIITDAGNYKVNIENKALISRIYDGFSMSVNDRLKRIRHSNLQNLNESDDLYDCCNRAFLRGVFLACGTIAEPTKSYHVEFAVGTRQISLDLIKLLHDNGFEAKAINRRGSNVVYIKDSTVIEQLLTFMGAQNQVLKFIDVRMQKQFTNQLNRENNFDLANLARTTNASFNQRDAIRRIRENGTFDLMDEDLKKMAILREENEDASLNELGEMFSPPITRSAVNYKIKKIIDFADKTKEEILSAKENKS